MPYGSSRTIGIRVGGHGVSSILVVILDYTINRLVLARYRNGNSNCSTPLAAKLKEWNQKVSNAGCVDIDVTFGIVTPKAGRLAPMLLHGVWQGPGLATPRNSIRIHLDSCLVISEGS